MKADKPNLRLIGTVAFLRRLVFGWERYGYGERLQERSADFLRRLDPKQSAFSRALALYNLERYNLDLLDEVAALGPDGLALHRRLVELAEDCSPILEHMLVKPPMQKLILATFAQAKADGAGAVRFRFKGDSSKRTVVDYHVENRWREALLIPESLEQPLRGGLARVKGIGFGRLLPYMRPVTSLPGDLEFTSVSEADMVVTLL